MGNIILLLFCFAAGIMLRRMGRLPENTSAALNAFIINIGLPAMALGYLNKIEIQATLIYAALMPWIMFLAGAAILWPLCRIMNFPRRLLGEARYVCNWPGARVPGLIALKNPDRLRRRSR
jgi:hypothetical protein